MPGSIVKTITTASPRESRIVVVSNRIVTKGDRFRAAFSGITPQSLCTGFANPNGGTSFFKFTAPATYTGTIDSTVVAGCFSSGAASSTVTLIEAASNTCIFGTTFTNASLSVFIGFNKTDYDVVMGYVSSTPNVLLALFYATITACNMADGITVSNILTGNGSTFLTNNGTDSRSAGSGGTCTITRLC